MPQAARPIATAAEIALAVEEGGRPLRTVRPPLHGPPFMSGADWWSVASRRPERLTLKIGGAMIEGNPAALIALIEKCQSPEILLRVDSRGGDVEVASAVAAALSRHPARIVVRVEGEAFSAAVRLLCAADDAHAVADAVFMIHGPFVQSGGNARTLRLWADRLDCCARAMAHALASHARRPIDDFLPLLLDGEDHFFNADQAEALGLINGQLALVKA